MNRKHWILSALLLFTLFGTGGGLAAWRLKAADESAAASQNQPEPSEAVRIAVATKREHRSTSTSIGTVLALQSVTLRNELPGTVRRVSLQPGAIVEPGAILVALDVSVEEAELAALKAQAVLAEANLARTQSLIRSQASPVAEADRAVAERDVALAQIDRTQAVIARKTIRAPFRARVGIADLHPGQFLEAGAVLTTLQGVADTVHVDFEVTQHVAAELRPGDRVDLIVSADAAPVGAEVVAVDARINPATRNATVRARFTDGAFAPAPGASVRVRVGQGPAREVVAVPSNALRRGPAGDHVFVIQTDEAGRDRAHVRAVKSGIINGDEVLILSGLEPGERVAASGSFKLRESVLVSIVSEPVLAANTR